MTRRNFSRGWLTVINPSAHCAAQAAVSALIAPATDDEALAIAVDQWRGNCVPTLLAWDLTTPEQFEAATRHVPDTEVAANVHVSGDIGRHRGWLESYLDLGPEALFLHHVGQCNKSFIRDFGQQVLPELRSAA